ncbi:AraC family transcriptional regulator [Rhizobium sp. BK251]|uniref:helix-turn-helix transcriptional regulator n=1 Tax=Rhizobium sp. BK251 TaxID=2512125 RepID=UPI0010E84C31|nr:AraC family transcriptional regulator [Rhizobium sp. BK251]TCL73704.1 AraC-like DNA-binding protein [Rhizobium sp. BK251]
MAEVVSNWVVVPEASLAGIARLRQVAGEQLEFACGGSIVVNCVLEGAYEVTDDRGSTFLGPGDIYFVQRQGRAGEGDRNCSADDDPVIIAGSPSAAMLCAAFSTSATALHATVRALPATLHITASEASAEPQISATLALLDSEIRNETCGRELLSNHLFEALFLYIIRYWYRRFPETSCLIKAFGDPYLARAIDRMHHQPGRHWNLEQLASIAGLSRAAFARRFKNSLGDTPLGYLTRWRMNIAAQMLDQAMDIRQICEKVGYVSEFAFSRAFSRHHGMPPTRYRNRSKMDEDSSPAEPVQAA